MASPKLACTVAVLSFLAMDVAWLTVGGAGARFLAVANDLRGGGGGATWAGWQLFLLGCLIYALLSVALCRFAVQPALQGERPGPEALVSGALLGLVVYGTFDFTNLALFGPDYGVGFAASDAAWGAFAMAASAWLGARL